MIYIDSDKVVILSDFFFFFFCDYWLNPSGNTEADHE